MDQPKLWKLMTHKYMLQVLKVPPPPPPPPTYTQLRNLASPCLNALLLVVYFLFKGRCSTPHPLDPLLLPLGGW